uniref:Uncharacterized protein n=1 Tax=Strongyloides venezuelensis TaxID=75913 RepID=A0A0K0FSQ3_STRVS
MNNALFSLFLLFNFINFSCPTKESILDSIDNKLDKKTQKINYLERKEIEKMNVNTVKVPDHPLELKDNRKFADWKPFVGEKVKQSSKMGKKLFHRDDDKRIPFASKETGGFRKMKRDLYIELKLEEDEEQKFNKDGEWEWDGEEEWYEDNEREWYEEEFDENNEKEWDEEQEFDEDSENEGNEDNESECYKDKEPKCDEDNIRIDEFLDTMRKAFTYNDTENNALRKEDPIKSFGNI